MKMVKIKEPLYISEEAYLIVARKVLNNLADLVDEVNEDLQEGESYYTMDADEIRRFCKEGYGEAE